MNMLFRIRNEEKDVAFRQVELWKKEHEVVQLAWALDDLIEVALADRDKDSRFLHYVAQRAKGSDKQQIAEAHREIQEYCDRSIQLHDLIRATLRVVGPAGQLTEKMEELNKATRDYHRWKEDYPDILIMGYQPVEQTLQTAVVAALNQPQQESDWRDLFAEGD